jgi:metallophosphoesterase (TIGR00282 family)
MIGDVVGRPGRRAVRALLPALRKEHGLDLVVANGENAAGGFGLTLEVAQELLSCGVDVITSGNHIWDQKEIIPYMDQELPILRPLNYPPTTPGRGFMRLRNALVVNLMGRVFMHALDCPFRTMDAFLEGLSKDGPRVILVDFHAEATSEKIAMGWYLDGRVSAVVGTHIHVPTADARLLPHSTAFVSDVGMVGPTHSIIGNTPQDVLARFLTGMPQRLNVPGGPVTFNSVLVEVDDPTGRAVSIGRLDTEVD